MARHPHHADCLVIQEHDPNGDESRRSAPSAAELEAHKRWAIDTFGADVWQTYSTMPWMVWGTDLV